VNLRAEKARQRTDAASPPGADRPIAIWGDTVSTERRPPPPQNLVNLRAEKARQRTNGATPCKGDRPIVRTALRIA
jgi:hypothetical protein